MNFFKFNLMFLIIAVFCAVGIMGRSDVNLQCSLHGASCVSDSECCGTARCHRYANRCQNVIDEAALQEQRERLRHVDNKYSTRL